MNILFISTENPYPPDHGHHIRSYNVLKHLAERNNIFFVGFSQTPGDLQHIQHLKLFCNSVDIFLIPGNHQPVKKILRLLTSLFSFTPFFVKRFYRQETEEKIIQIINNNTIDLVHFDMLHLGMYFNSVGNIPKILINHNVESLRLYRLMKTQKNILIKSFLYTEYIKLYRFEKKMSKRFDKCIVVSETDKSIIMKLSGAQNIETVENGVDINYFQPNHETTKSRSLVWAGNMADPYNKDAIIYFLDDIYPLIRINIPDIYITFVGGSPPKKLLDHARKNRNLHVTGYVNDVRNYVASASVFIAPLRSGSGTKIKVLNALAQGKAVITTSIGAEGLIVENKKNIIISDDPKEFAANTIMLLKNPDTAKQIGRNGRLLIEKYYAWDIIFRQMDRIYEATKQ